MSKNRRVVVTGLDTVTPLGNTVRDTWEGMKAGRNGITPITLFDTENLKRNLALKSRLLIRKPILRSMIFYVPIDMHSFRLLQHSRR